MIGQKRTESVERVAALLVALGVLANLHLATAQASFPEVGLGSEDITLSLPSDQLRAGAPVRIYIRIHNAGDADVSPTVQLSSGGAAIGTTPVVRVRAHAVGDTWFDWQVPDQPFAVTALLRDTGGDTVTGNDQATSRRFTPLPAVERDIFSPPAERSSTTVPVPPIPIYEGINLNPTTSPASAASVAGTVPPLPDRSRPSEPPTVLVWLPYALILLGAVGFAWALRYRHKQPRPAPRTIDLRAAPPLAAAPKKATRPAAKKGAKPAKPV